MLLCVRSTPKKHNPKPKSHKEKIKMKNPKDNSIFMEVIEWLGCPFLFNRKFTDDEIDRIYHTVCERYPAAETNPTKFRLSAVAYDVCEDLGFKLSDM